MLKLFDELVKYYIISGVRQRSGLIVDWSSPIPYYPKGDFGAT